MIQVVTRTSQGLGETSHISFIDRVGGLGGDILSQEFLKTTRVDIQAAAQGQSVVVVVYIENANARCDVVFMMWFKFYPPLETEDPFKSIL
jgi:hypothetical protein